MESPGGRAGYKPWRPDVTNRDSWISYCPRLTVFKRLITLHLPRGRGIHSSLIRAIEDVFCCQDMQNFGHTADQRVA